MNQNFTFKDFIPLFPSLIAGFFALFGGLAGNTIIQHRQRQAETKSLASAFYGEIKALVGIMKRRQYILGIENAIKDAKQGKITPFQIRVTRKYFNVYEKNLDKIGFLPNPFPRKIVNFYTIMTAILEDLDVINEENFYKEKLEVIISYLEELSSLIEEVDGSGQEICSQMEDMKLVRKEKSRKSFIKSR